MKQCNKCKQTKPLTEFYKCKPTPSGLSYFCKTCSKYWNQKRNKRLKLNYTLLYYIPAHNYVGITNQPVKRMEHHKFKGMDVTGYMIIGRYINRADAIATEFRLHRLGYNG